jgi:isopentenyl diphosphate isomerase/L-lactate dehydrogenase-like FMN-dependent dehydrogenase
MVKAVNEKIPLLIDSGVRHGADVIKAIALGAKGVLIGRPYAYAMASHGDEGVLHLIRTMWRISICSSPSAVLRRSGE